MPRDLTVAIAIMNLPTFDFAAVRKMGDGSSKAAVLQIIHLSSDRLDYFRAADNR